MLCEEMSGRCLYLGRSWWVVEGQTSGAVHGVWGRDQEVK